MVVLTSQHLSPHYITSLHPLIRTLNLNWENWREAQRPTLLKMCLLSASPSSTSLNPSLPPSPMFRPCRKMLKLCGETQDRLAQELILFEFTIERDVIEPLYDLAEVNTPGCNHPISFSWCPDHLVQLPALQQPLSYMTFALLIGSLWLSSLFLSGSCITLTFSALIHQTERQSPWEHWHSKNSGSVPCPVSHHHTEVALLCSSPRWKSQTSRNKGNI